MDLGYAVGLMRSAVLQTLLVASPILATGVITGLLVSIFQATTSLQEQTLSFVPKIAAIFFAIFIFGPWMFTAMVQYTLRLFEQIPRMVTG